MATLGFVVSEFNRPITAEMEELALEAAEAHEAEVGTVVTVPGSYDSPLAADRLAKRAEIDAVVVIGSIITGDTAHDRVIANAVTNQLSSISVERNTPITLGITGPDMSAAEAKERVDKGAVAVESALSLLESLPKDRVDESES